VGSKLTPRPPTTEFQNLSRVQGVLASPKMMKDIVERRRSEKANDDEAHAASQMLHSMKRLEVTRPSTPYARHSTPATQLG
jgi:hypothetical protein